ncbi:hypothetical protein KCP71_09710 [Salmonella enterica subsp. enterica]|nr:hypothetical protein KCP71_09710 [Salmonella enterica subsp. enterica]
MQAGQQRSKRFAFRHKGARWRFVSCLIRYSMRRASERSPTLRATFQALCLFPVMLFAPFPV